MIAQLPTILALLGTALLALAIFAPSRAAAGPTVSFAPPIAAPVERTAEQWSSSDAFASSFDPFAGGEPSYDELDARADVFIDGDVFIDAETSTDTGPSIGSESGAVTEPGWPGLVDPRAAGCDVGARLALVEALLAVRAPWAQAILRRAVAEEHDPAVLAALTVAEYAGAGDGPAYEAGTARTASHGVEGLGRPRNG